MKLYHWCYNSHGRNDYMVMAETQEEALAAVRACIAKEDDFGTPPDDEFSSDYTVHVYGPGEVVSHRND